jgi:hypothetical protein
MRNDMTNQLSELAQDWREQAQMISGFIKWMEDLRLKSVDVPTLRTMSQMYSGSAAEVEAHINPAPVNEREPF